MGKRGKPQDILQHRLEEATIQSGTCEMFWLNLFSKVVTGVQTAEASSRDATRENLLFFCSAGQTLRDAKILRLHFWVEKQERQQS